MKKTIGLFLLCMFTLSFQSDLFGQSLKEKGDGESRILIANRSGKISPKTSAKLIKAFNVAAKGQYKAFKVVLSPGKGGGDLAFLVNDKSTSHVLVPCVESSKDGYYLRPITTGIRNCNKSDGCTQCKTPCGCGRNGGTGSCVEVVTDNLKGISRQIETFLMN